MDYILSMFGSEEAKKSEDKAEDKMSITTPVGTGTDYVGDLPTPAAGADDPSHPFRPPAHTTDKRLQSWRIGPRYVPTTVIGRGSYGEVAAGIDTLT